MKKFLKNNLVVIICFLVLFTLANIGLYKEFREVNNNYKLQEKNIENCKDMEYETPEAEAYCKNLLENGVQKEGFFDVFGDLIGQLDGLRLVSGIVLLIPCLYELDKLKKKKQTKDYQKQVFVRAYKYLWLIPSIVIYLILAVCIFTNFNFTAIGNYWEIESIRSVPLFLGCYILNAVLLSGIYINITLSVSKKFKNFFGSLIVSVLAILGIEFILQYGIGFLFDKIFKNSMGVLFNILDMYYLNDSFGILPKIATLIGIYLVTLAPPLLLYQKKKVNKVKGK